MKKFMKQIPDTSNISRLLKWFKLFNQDLEECVESLAVNNPATYISQLQPCTFPLIQDQVVQSSSY